MSLDLDTVMAMTALVVTVSGIVFVAETVIRRDDGAGRIWAGAFLAGPVATLSYLVSLYTPSVWWAVAVGNAAYVSTVSAMWLGCRRYNGRSMGWATALVVAAGVLAAAVVLAAGPDGGSWAGMRTMLVLLTLFGVLGGIECLRGDLNATHTAWALAAVFLLHTLMDITRLIVFSLEGPQGEVFTSGLSTIRASVVTVTLTIVAVVVVSVLRAGRTPIRGIRALTSVRSRTVDEIVRATGADSGVLVAEQFRVALQGLLTRAGWHDEIVAVLAVRVGDVARIGVAYGSEAAREFSQTWRHSVRWHAPAVARVGEDGASVLLVSTVVASRADAHRVAGRIARGVFEDLRAVPEAALPAVGVGMALTIDHGSDAQRLVAAARAASQSGEPVADAADGLDPAGA